MMRHANETYGLKRSPISSDQTVPCIECRWHRQRWEESESVSRTIFDTVAAWGQIRTDACTLVEDPEDAVDTSKSKGRLVRDDMGEDWWRGV